MSTVSKRSSHVSLMRSSLAHRNSLAIYKLQINENTVKNVLDKFLLENNSRPYEDLVCMLRDCTIDEKDLATILNSSSLCVGMMGRETRLLVEVLFSLNWSSMSSIVVEPFIKWSLDLLTAQIYHAPTALSSLIKLLGKSLFVWCEDPPKEQLTIFSHVHSLIAQIVEIIPMSSDVLLRCAMENFPYYKQSPAVNQAYVHNLLWITRYIPSLADHLLTLILNRLIIMDVNLRNRSENNTESVFAMEEIEDNTDDLIESLDLCMKEFFYWIDLKGPAALELLIPIYQRVILPTHGTNNVQFIILYALSLDITQVNNFFEMLWQLVPSARVGPSLRQASIAHLTGLLARAKYIPFAQVKIYIHKMAEWCHSYIKAQENLRSNIGNNPHNVFYSVCQSLFYLIAFKHKNLFYDKKGLVFIESLNLSRIVMSSLNPLRVCHVGVAETFASITRIHQIVYCHTVMEHNSRHFLKTKQDEFDRGWFPYDPYTLPKSFKWIQPVYGEYDDNLLEKPGDVVEMCDDDDFLATSPSVNFMSKSLNSLRHAY